MKLAALLSPLGLCVSLLSFLLLAGCMKNESTDWNKTEAMIPARDGVKLHTLIFSPKNASGKLPFLIERSPYGFDNGRAEHTLATRYKELADEGFIFVLQDIRGRYQVRRPVRDAASGARSFESSVDR